MKSNLQDYSHKRLNILTGEWVLVSPQRAKRPWQGQNETISQEVRSKHDPNCYLCAGNMRINGEQNPDYKDVFVFENDFPALQSDSLFFSYAKGMFKAESEQGICKVICFSPDHSKSLADMAIEEIYKVIEVWQKEYKILGQNDNINYVQIFENKGAVMGCSNPHPHGQIWSQSTLPNEVEKKDFQQRQYYNENATSLLGVYLSEELEAQERIIYTNEDFVVLIPFWSVWPFETMIIPKKHSIDITTISKRESKAFADAISVITKAYDELFSCSFPYSSGIHQAPTNKKKNDYWHWHMSFYPPLLRSASVKKFMVGYEMFGSPQRDITAEQAAVRLRDLIG
jgi:UDPglucose--hexose-1-phosphate uridylyltransferase